MHLLAALLFAQANATSDLSELATTHDVVAIVQQIDISYETVRDFPNKGHATLRVLIGYKGAERGDLIEVHDQGLEDSRCYFPDFENEGNRYLVFLNREEGVKHRGVRPTCQLPVLVTQDNKYALKYPIDGVRIDPSLAQPMAYADPAAFVELADLTFEQSNALTESGVAVIEETDPYAPSNDRLMFTQGVPINSLRELLFPQSGVEESSG